MKIVIAFGGDQAAWIETLPVASSHILINVKNAAEFSLHTDADAFIDLAFNGNFYAPADKPLLINETIKTIGQLSDPPPLLARFCGWPGFCERPVWELATSGHDKNWLDLIMHTLGKQYEIVADKPGLVAPRILSMIINEALNALAEGISSGEEIDKAMKLGTNYPEGPLVWANKIGLNKIYELLTSLAVTNPRYTPHPLLKTSNP